MLAIALAAAAAPGLAADVTSQRLQNPAAEPQNWLMVHHDYDNSRHSQLKDINRDTVKNLQLKFMFSIGGRSTGGTLARQGRIDPAGGRRLHVCHRHLVAGDEIRRAQRRRGRAAVALRSQDHAVAHHPRARHVRQQGLSLHL